MNRVRVNASFSPRFHLKLGIVTELYKNWYIVKFDNPDLPPHSFTEDQLIFLDPPDFSSFALKVVYISENSYSLQSTITSGTEFGVFIRSSSFQDFGYNSLASRNYIYSSKLLTAITDYLDFLNKKEI